MTKLDILAPSSRARPNKRITVNRIQEAFGRAGVIFVDTATFGRGVRLKRSWRQGPAARIDHMSGGADNADYRLEDGLGALSLQPLSVMTGFDRFFEPLTRGNPRLR